MIRSFRLNRAGGALLCGAVFGACLPGRAEVHAQPLPGFYLSTEVGFASGAPAETMVFGTDHPTRCDRLLYPNPADFPTDPECSGSGSRLDGLFTFDPEAGLGGRLAVRYAFAALSAEIETDNQIG